MQDRADAPAKTDAHANIGTKHNVVQRTPQKDNAPDENKGYRYTARNVMTAHLFFSVRP